MYELLTALLRLGILKFATALVGAFQLIKWESFWWWSYQVFCALKCK